MAYRDFNLKKVVTDFQLDVKEVKGIFSQLKEASVSDSLLATLKNNVPLALAINTEKARSELIIANVLVELRHQYENQIGLFSGIKFDVDKSKKLNGYCDFIISLTPEQMFLKAPVITIVEAKNDNIINGFGQCIAEMVAAQQFNANEVNEVKTVYGVVTSGNYWQFMKLQQLTVSIDLQDYQIDDIQKIMGILVAMINQTA